jgi:hypothetical protein
MPSCAQNGMAAWILPVRSITASYRVERVITIGPYRFSQSDSRRTIENFDALWSLFSADRPAATAHLATLYPSVTGHAEVDLAAVWHALLSAGPALRAAGQLPARVDGHVAALHRGTGGVPKHSVAGVDVDWRGVVGDRQKVRVHHGRPWQALCLWSGEVIDQLAGHGHPIAPGCAGENLTLRGLDWSQVRPGVRLRVGSVECDVIAFALPCRSNARWFTNGEFRVMHHERGPVSRVYAVVTQPGRIAVGDPAILEP